MIKALAGTSAAMIRIDSMVVVKDGETVFAGQLSPEQMKAIDDLFASGMSVTALLSALDQVNSSWRNRTLTRDEIADLLGELDRMAQDLDASSLSAQGIADIAGAVAVEPERNEEWRRILGEVASSGGRVDVLRFVLGLLYAGLHSRISWWARCAAVPCMAYLCWVLRSQVRTWVPLLGLLLWGGLETAVDTGAGAGIVFVILGGVGFYGLIEWLCKRWDVQVGRRAEDPQE